MYVDHEWFRTSLNACHSKELDFTFPMVYKTTDKYQPIAYPEIIKIIFEMSRVFYDVKYET